MTNTDTTTPVLDLAVWCRDRALAHRDMEQHEMAMYPTGAHRDTAIVEWTVRCLGNPNLDTAEEALHQIATQHHLELSPNGTAEWLQHRVKELTAELEQTRATANVRQGQLQQSRKQAAALADEVGRLIADNARLREQLFAQKPVIEAAEAWAEDCEDNGTAAGLRNTREEL